MADYNQEMENVVTEQPLLVRLLFHPASLSARKLGREIYRQLNEEAVVPGLRIPTVFCPVSRKDRPPLSTRFDLAQKNFFVVLADDYLEDDDDWRRYVGDVWAACHDPNSRCVPFQLSKNAWPLDERLSGVSFPPAYLCGADGQLAYITRRVLVELCRFLCYLPSEGDQSKAPVQLFLSHAKMDMDKAPKVVEKLINALKEDQPVRAWVDSGEIPGGSKFADSIAAGVKDASLLAVLTDNYATREWCREEILLAKENQRPIAVIDALSKYEVRSFPYLGNVPRIRWDENPQAGIDLILKETLRTLHSLETLARFKQENDEISSRPPEFATLAGLPPGTSVLYPDPPLGVGEAKRLGKTKVILSTPLQRLAMERTLQGKRIALSMSESTDAEHFGMDMLHLDAAMQEISRYLLIKGATLAYGGHLGSEGYMQKLAELVRTHNAADYGSAVDRIVNFRGWPLPRLSVEKRAEMRAVAQIQEVRRPADIDESLGPDFVADLDKNLDPTTSPENRFVWARGMTEMRLFQADSKRSGVIARVVLGGNFGPTLAVTENGTRTVRWYAGRIPGVMEEVVLSVLAGQPVFLLGAFGGAARLVIDLLHGIDREEATWEYQKRAPFAPEMRKLYEQRGLEWLDYPQMTALLRNKSVAGINPLISAARHEQLFESVDPLEIAELLISSL
jgi:hypothetical protein